MRYIKKKIKIRTSLENSMPRSIVMMTAVQFFYTASYAVLYSTFLLYAVTVLHFTNQKAAYSTGIFVGLSSCLHLMGNFIGGRYLSYRALFVISMILTTLGIGTITLPSITFFYWGGAAFLTGSGLSFLCTNALVSQILTKTDPRQSRAFLWNYSGMIAGLLLAFIGAGYFQLKGQYHSLFIVTTFINFLTVALILFCWRKIPDTHTIFVRERKAIKWNISWGIGLIFLLLLGVGGLLSHPFISDHILIAAGIIILGIIFTFALNEKQRVDRGKLWMYATLWIMAVIFWTVYQMIPNGILLFAQTNVHRRWNYMGIAPSWFNGINPIVMLLGGPILSSLFNVFRSWGFRFTLTHQLAFSLLLAGIAVLFIPLGIHFSNENGYSSSGWIFLTYIFLSIAELLIGPLGYALVGEISPPKWRWILTTFWMMSSTTGAAFAGYFSGLVPCNAQNLQHPLVTNMRFSSVFELLGGIAIVASIVLILSYAQFGRLFQPKQATSK